MPDTNASAVAVGFTEFDAGGGLHDDEDATIVSAKFELEEWKDKSGQASSKAAPAIVCNIIRQFNDGTQDNYPLKYSVGGPDRWAPSGDGMVLNRVKTDKPYNVHQDSAFGKLCQAMIKAGAGDVLKSASLKDWHGQAFHWLNVPLTDKDGKVIKDAKGYEKFRPEPSRYIGKQQVVSGAPSPGVPSQAVPAAANPGDAQVETLQQFAAAAITAGGPLDVNTLFLKANADAQLKKSIPVATIMKLLKGEQMYGGEGFLFNDNLVSLMKAGNQVTLVTLSA
jgi:hypothetical protein